MMVVVVVMLSFIPVMVVVVVVAMPSFIPVVHHRRERRGGALPVPVVLVCVCAATGKVYEYSTRTHERRWLESPPGYNVWTPRRHSPVCVNTTPPLTSVCEHNALICYNTWYLDSLQYVIPWLPTACDTLTPCSMWYLDSLQHVIPWLPTTSGTLTHYNMWNTYLDSLQHVKHTPWLTTTCQTHTLTRYNMSNSHLGCLKYPSRCQSIPASALVCDK